MGGQPSGTVTFLFTDIESSTRLWESDEPAMRRLVAEHDAILRAAISNRRGVVFATGGDVEVRDLGEHRLRDLSQSERVFQVRAADLRSEFPPLRSLDAERTNLPAELTSFVGRDAELRALEHMLDDHRIVTITGVGGVGKTRLAVQAGARVAADFPDGVWV